MRLAWFMFMVGLCYSFAFEAAWRRIKARRFRGRMVDVGRPGNCNCNCFMICGHAEGSTPRCAMYKK